MYCDYCGTKLLDDSKFCSYCGKQVKIADDVKEKAVWCDFVEETSQQEKVPEATSQNDYWDEIRDRMRRHEEQEAKRLQQEEKERAKREKEKEIEAFLGNDRYYKQLLIKQGRVEIVYTIVFLVACACTLILGIYMFPVVMQEQLPIVEWLNISGTWLETVLLFVVWLFVIIIIGIIALFLIVLNICLIVSTFTDYDTKLDSYKKNISENWEQRISIREETYKKMKKK